MHSELNGMRSDLFLHMGNALWLWKMQPLWIIHGEFSPSLGYSREAQALFGDNSQQLLYKVILRWQTNMFRGGLSTTGSGSVPDGMAPPGV